MLHWGGGSGYDSSPDSLVLSIDDLLRSFVSLAVFVDFVFASVLSNDG